MTTKEVIIIGGGLSGIMAARALFEKGVEDILIVEKSRSVGGRLATRRIGEGKADHGAQFFTVRSGELQQNVDKWLEEGWVKRWFGNPYPRYTSTGGMNALAKQLAETIPVKLNTKVSAIRDGRDVPLEIELESGEKILTNHCIVTAPVPQALLLLPGMTEPLVSTISFAPCFVGMFTFNGLSSIPSPGHTDENLPEGVERVVDHHKKGISQSVTVSVYMTGEWAKKNETLEDDGILTEIQRVAEHYLAEGSEIATAELKRWRYAEAETVMRSPFVEVGTSKRIIICGDAFLREDDEAGRTRFESAYLSGISAGERVACKGKGI
ncbi:MULTISPECIES: NAD(P)/FAD-dependent oxidoreductase [Bacillaceae]|uniref:NAD(P)/FAD-dependent oxidoreductase n=1 Tax=Bacillaceae TaxID=186817 RepID=UPI001C576463|nr:FAD-dependent oxidoreductase [Rossellomorea sp. YZS02]MBW3112786.1 FAD-dependent oxidoreductase [Bacillus sp. MCCB 382]MDX8342764.1 FAD-dependent oxidoreductase [Rossellomorea sp. YZS02]